MSRLQLSARVIIVSCCVVGVLAGCRDTDSAAQPGGAPDLQTVGTPPAERMQVAAPLGLPPVPVPAGNPITPEKVELGRMLYFDKRLSKDGSVSCATCHDPAMAWAERRATSEGIKKQVGERNSPTVINAAYLPVQFWDGRAATLEEQALGPIENPIEMGHSLADLVATLQAVPEYTKRFQQVFGTGVTPEGIAKAIATFERTILSGDSPYDRFNAGNAAALTDQQKRGMQTFMGRGLCGTCHTPPLFTSGQFYNAGVGMDKPEPDAGRQTVTGKESDRGSFRVPPLREVANTAPYFHDGSAATLEAAVDLMASGGRNNPNLAVLLKGVREANLTAQDREDLVAFLHALSGEYPRE